MKEKFEFRESTDVSRSAKIIEHNIRADEIEQYKERVELSGAKVDVYDVSPENPKTEVPTVFAPGWIATPYIYRKNIRNLVDAGRRVISVDAPHGIDAEAIEGYPSAELRKTAAFLNALDKKNIDKVDIVAHSEGAIYMTIAAILRPEKVRNMVLVDSAGMIGKDTAPRLMVGFELDNVRQVVNKVQTAESPENNILAPLKAVAAGPLQSLREVLALSNTDIREMLEKLKKQGVGISVIHAVDDAMFPMERAQEVINTDYVDGFYSVRGTHQVFTLQPERYTMLAETALTELERKKITKERLTGIMWPIIL